MRKGVLDLGDVSKNGYGPSVAKAGNFPKPSGNACDHTRSNQAPDKKKKQPPIPQDAFGKPPESKRGGAAPHLGAFNYEARERVPVERA